MPTQRAASRRALTKRMPGRKPSGRSGVVVRTLKTWDAVIAETNMFLNDGWVFRGHADVRWKLKTSLERQFTGNWATVERVVLERFLRTAPRLLPPHLVPGPLDAFAWLGLIQHYGGPTRLLDVTRSPFVALFFAF